MESPTKNAAAQALGRLGGAVNSKAQQQARKQNAQRAGRPRRVCVHCGEPVVAGHVDRALDVTCGAHGWQWQQRSAAAEPAPTIGLSLSRADAEQLLADLTGTGSEAAARTRLATFARRLRTALK
jgi:ribosomal protein S27AE